MPAPQPLQPAVQEPQSAEEKARLEVSWRLWDQALQAAADPAGSQTLAVAEPPTSSAANRAQTEITMSDQIPVWLKPTPGKVLTSLLRLKTAAEQSRVRQEARMVRNADKKGKSAKDKAKSQPGRGRPKSGRHPQTGLRSQVSRPRSQVASQPRSQTENPPLLPAKQGASRCGVPLHPGCLRTTLQAGEHQPDRHLADRRGILCPRQTLRQTCRERESQAR